MFVSSADSPPGICRLSQCADLMNRGGLGDFFDHREHFGNFRGNIRGG